MIRREALIPASVLMTVGATFVGAHVVDRKAKDIVPVVRTVRQDTAIGKPLSRAVKHTFPVIDRENIGGRSVPVGVLPVDTEGLKRSLDDAEKKIAATGRSETLRKEVLEIRSSVDSGIIAQDELGGARQIRGRLLPVITAFGDEHDRMVRRAWGDVGYIAGGVLLAGGSIDLSRNRVL